MLVMLSGLLFDAGQLALAGAALGAAINIKLVPVFLIPVLGLQLRTRREALQFFGALALAALPFLPLLLGIPTTFVKNAILYNSSANRWGIYGLFKMALETRHVAKVAAPMVDLYWRFGRYVMMASVIALGIAGRRLRRWSAAELVALGMIAFLVFTPGFGIQYTIYVLPALFAVSLARGAIYSTVAGLFALVVYLEFWTGEVPYHSVFVGHFTFIGTELGLCTWLYLCASAIALLRGRRSAAPPPRVLSESPP
jgi:hypothetical protein